MSDESSIDLVQHRSEITYIFDGKDVNHNGNPQSGDDRPRIDPHTGNAVLTDVRLKRYLRDQFTDDFRGDSENGVYIADVTLEESEAPSRTELLERCLEGIDDPSDVDGDVLKEFLDYAIDVRLFGAAITFDGDSDLADRLREQASQLQGPLQFSPSESLNEVVLNSESRQLSNVIRSSDTESAEQGSFATDHRIKYGVFPVHGVVNENAARDTRLREEDVERLDTAMWRAMKNQPLSRSKKGQEPRLYIRVEYEENNFHIGLQSALDLEADKQDTELRSINDHAIDLSDYLARLDEHSEVVGTVHVTADTVTEFAVDGERGGRSFLYDSLRDVVGNDSVRVIDVYKDSPATDH